MPKGREARVSREGWYMGKYIVVVVLLAANAVAVFCLLNPAHEQWTTQAVVFLVLECLFGIVIGLPVFLHHYLREKKPFTQSLTDTLDSLLSFITGWI